MFVEEVVDLCIMRLEVIFLLCKSLFFIKYDKKRGNRYEKGPIVHIRKH